MDIDDYFTIRRSGIDAAGEPVYAVVRRGTAHAAPARVLAVDATKAEVLAILRREAPGEPT